MHSTTSVNAEPHSAAQSTVSVSAALYGSSIFLGAFLLFLVEPLLAKYFLPWFGGSAAVWTTCMLFFQLLLLAGYTYAHVIVNRFAPRTQCVVHCFILAAAAALLLFLSGRWSAPITPTAAWKPYASSEPIAALLWLLTISVGLPYFALATTAPLLQAWLSPAQSEHTVYRLYAISNAASFLALLSYPLLVEPSLPLKWQARLWSLCFLIYAGLCSYCAIQSAKQTAETAIAVNEQSSITSLRVSTPGLGSYALWISLAACGSLMFLSTTSQICQNIAVVPLLWILPLSLYLLSFVICFEKPQWYLRGVTHAAFAILLAGACYVLAGGAVRSIALQIIVYACTLFIACMICHGELYLSKPAPRFLTSFYLMVAVGGVLGGVVAAIVAPLMFKGPWEYEIGLWSSALLLLYTLFHDQTSWLHFNKWALSWIIGTAILLPTVTGIAASGRLSLSSLPSLIAVAIALLLLGRRENGGGGWHPSGALVIFPVIALIIFGGVLVSIVCGQLRSSVVVVRNFYGVLAVREQSTGDGWQIYRLVHGRVPHGWQFQSPEKRKLPTSYYGYNSGVGRVFAALRQEHSTEPLRVGVIGLGVGTLAAYGELGDYFRFYEINPNVIRIAEDDHFFSYLRDCPSKLDVVMGDGRLSMEDELDRGNLGQFDLLVIDAFSGDAIPVHLLTKEAFQIYLSHIRRPDGVIAVHISNTYIDLTPIVGGIANHFGLSYRIVHTPAGGQVTAESLWAIVSANNKLVYSLGVSGRDDERSHAKKALLWTDQSSNLVRLLQW